MTDTEDDWRPAMNLKPVKHSVEFAEILRIIHSGRAKAFEAVNVALIDTYSAVGEYLSVKVEEAATARLSAARA